MENIELKSRRLVLRPIQLADAKDVHQLETLPVVNTYNTLTIPETITQTESVISAWLSAKNRNFIFVITPNNQHKFIGLIAINLGRDKYKDAEVWYKIHPDYWNRGYATEALQTVILFGFTQLKLHRIEAGCAVNNKASIRTLEKAGMLREGQKRKALPLKTGWSDNFEYAILASDI